MQRTLSINLTAICLALSLCACGSSEHPIQTSVPATANVTSATPRAETMPQMLLPPAGQSSSYSSTSEIVTGSASFFNRSPRNAKPVTASNDGAISLNFVNAPVDDVAKSVLGDFLKLNYVVAANVQGSITLQTSQPLGRALVLPALETAFQVAGLAIVETQGLYRIIPLADAARSDPTLQFGPAAAHPPGFGVEVIPLRYVNAGELQHMLDPIVPNGSVLKADSQQNFLVVAGTTQERAAIRENVRLFDVDSLAGMSFAMFTLKSADAKTMVAELGEVLGGHDSPAASMVRLVPIQRMNAVLAISPQVKYLHDLAGWVDRLDRAQPSSDRRIYVYYVQNGRASDLANVLSKVLGTSSGKDMGSSSTPSLNDPSLASALSPVSGVAPQSGSFTQPQTRLFNQPDPSQGLQPQGGGIGISSDQNDSGNSSPVSLHVTADETNNALLIYGTPNEYSLIENALNKLDVAPQQVLIEAAVAEVTLTSDLRFGVQYYFKSGSSHQIIQSNGTSSALNATFPGFAYLFSSGSDIQLILNALEDITTVNVVSAPEILVLNNQTAQLQVGDQVPIATQSAVSVTTAGAPVVNNIEYKDTGVILKVTPRVNEGGLVLMDIAQEVSDVAQTTTSTLDSPTIQERKISSNIAVQDGETVALGGLIRDNSTQGRSGIPLLQDIPYVGALFGTTTKSLSRTELLVLLTPHVVQGVQKLRDVTEELRRKMPATRPLL